MVLDHDSPSRDQCKSGIGVEQYFIFFQMNLLDPTWAFVGFLHLSQWDEIGSSFLDGWVLFWAGLHGRPRNMSLVHLPPGDHDSPSRDQWKSLEYIWIYGFETYFIFCQMNCSIQLELLVDFFICLHGTTWKFIFRWAEFCFGLGYMAGSGMVIDQRIAIPRPM